MNEEKPPGTPVTAPTPGQAAYEAGGGAIHSYERIQRRAWDDLPPAVREGYEAAAQAVLEADAYRTLGTVAVERDQLRAQLTALRSGIAGLAADLDRSAAETRPSRKSEIETETAIALRKLVETP